MGVNIITVNSSLLETDKGISPIDGELQALLFAVHATDFWIRGSPDPIILYSDCSGMLDLMKKPLTEITNLKHQKLMLKLQAYAFTTVHIKGVQNQIADCLSRLCSKVVKSIYSPDEVPRILSISKKASIRRKQLECQDPLVLELGEIVSHCEKYLQCLNYLENRTPVSQMDPNCELRQLTGGINSLSVRTLDNGTRIVVKDDCEILVPTAMRQRMMVQLHKSHPGSEMMIRATKKRIFWPNMRKMLHGFYNSCKECTENAHSQPAKTHEVDQTELFDNFIPAEHIAKLSSSWQVKLQLHLN